MSQPSAVLWAALSTSCTLLLPYEELATTETVCSNREDDDADGYLDCDDEDCDGQCAEGSNNPASCVNQRDDDGDGRTDALDASCWPIAWEPVITRCATTGGAELDLRDPERVYFVNGAESFDLTNLSGTQPPLTRADVPVLAASVATVSGTLTALSAELMVDPDTRALVGLVPLESAPLNAPLLADAISRTVGVLIDTFDESVTLLAPGYAETFSAQLGGATVSMSLAWNQTGLVLELTRDGITETFTGTPEGDATVPQSRVAMQVDGRVGVRAIGVDLEGETPCGYVVNEIASTALPVLDLGASTSVARSPSLSCALVVGCAQGDLGWRRALTSWSSRDGRTWEMEAADAAPSSAREPIASAAIAWDESAGAFVAAIARASGAGGAVELYESTDCAAWARTESYEAPSPLLAQAVSCDPAMEAGAPSVGLLVRGDRRELFYAARRDDGIDVRALSSGAWVTAGAAPLDIELPLSFVAVGPRDVALVHRLTSDATAIGLSVWPEGDEIGAVGRGSLIGPSGDERAFDRFSLPSATLVMDPSDPRLATIYYAGRGDTISAADRRLGAVGSARLELAPPR